MVIKMMAEWCMQKIAVVLFCFFVVSDNPVSEALQSRNNVMEIYNHSNAILFSKDIMIAQVSPQEILSGAPILYDRFRIDGWVFEWLISNNYENDYYEDCALVVSRENDTENSQVIRVAAESRYGVWVSAENKFKYVDVNFDSVPDLLICTGSHGNQGLETYYCFLQTENGFVEAPTFTDISNPSIDTERKLILSQWRNSGSSHSWAEYQCRNNTYSMYRELCEELEWTDDGKEVWVWSINDEEVMRNDEFSTEEIAEFLYGENSEWKLADDRWRTLYNSGLTVDYSIYAEP